MAIITQTSGSLVPSDSGDIGTTGLDDEPVITLSRRVERQPDKWQFSSTDNTQRGYVPNYSNNIWKSAAFSFDIDYQFTEDGNLVSGSNSDATFGPAWDTEFSLDSDVKGETISIGKYSQNQSPDNPAQSTIRAEYDLVTGELSNAALYGIYVEDNADNSYNGENWEPCGRYVINTKNLLTEWNGENRTSSVGDWSAGGLATPFVETTIVYNNSKASIGVVNSGAGTGSAYMTALVNLQNFKLTGYAYRAHTEGIPRVLSGTTLLWTHSLGVGEWEFFDIDFAADTANIYFQNQSTASAKPVYFDNLRVTDANDTTGWSPFAANRSCSAYLMNSILSQNSNRISRQTQSAWSIPV